MSALPAKQLVSELLLDIWQEVFGMPREEVEPQDSFFAIGGTSIQAVKLMNRVREVFDVKLDLPTIYTEGSVEGLIALIEQHRAAELARLLIEVEGLSGEEALRLLGERGD